MTVVRRDGNDSPMGAWMRSNLRSSDHISISDVDYMITAFRQGRMFNQSTRDVQVLLDWEFKSHGSEPEWEQREALFLRHQIFTRKSEKDGDEAGKYYLKRIEGKSPNIIFVRHYGFYFLSVENDVPQEGTLMRWGKFDNNGNIIWRSTTRVRSIIEVLDLRRRPDKPNTPEFPIKLTRSESVVEDIRDHHCKYRVPDRLEYNELLQDDVIVREWHKS